MNILASIERMVVHHTFFNMKITCKMFTLPKKSSVCNCLLNICLRHFRILTYGIAILIRQTSIPS